MATKWEIKLLKPTEKLQIFAGDAWARSMPELEKWMRAELIPAFVNGGLGIVGLSQTEFYKFITSPEGLSQLGIDASQPPKLLQAYLKSAFSIRIYTHQMNLKFGDYAKLKAATPHPATGTGHLHIDSWLEWVDGMEVNRGFVPREKIGKASKRIRLEAPLGGLMLPRGAYGSTGLWRFPAQLRNYEAQWFDQNINQIEKVLTEKMIEVFIMKLVT